LAYTGLITTVSGRWTVPTLNCVDTPNSGVSIWVGTGGVGNSSGDLLQTGIFDNCVNGVQQDIGWWQEWPELQSGKIFRNLSISPGDSIKASVYQMTESNWVTELDDLTTGLTGYMETGDAWAVCPNSGGPCSVQGTTVNRAYSGGHTAEWIVEDYDLGYNLDPFANYGTVNFSNLRIAGPSPWSLSVGEGLEIVQNGVVLSVPSRPESDGFQLRYVGP
jgi:hypothetical protein